jgi:hypothetical protein
VNIVKQFDATGRLIAVSIIFILALQLACAPAPLVVGPPNQAPVIESINYAPDAFGTSEVQIDCLAKDADSDNLTYKWSAEAGSIKGAGNNILWMPPGKMGKYPITLVVSDGRGGVATENISIRVVTNADGTATPLVELKLKMGGAETPVVAKQRIQGRLAIDILCLVEGSASANDLIYTWTAKSGEMTGKGLVEGKANKVTWKAPYVKGDYNVDVSVKDSQGNEARGLVIVTVFCCGDS